MNGPRPSYVDGPDEEPRSVDIALFLPKLAWGGAERVMLQLSREWVEMGYNVDMVLASAEGDFLNEVPPEVVLKDLGKTRVAEAFVPLVRYVRRAKPRTLLSTLEHANLIALAAAPFLGTTKVVIREANTASMDTERRTFRGKLILNLMRLLYPRATDVIAVSEGVSRDLQSSLAVKAERIHVIPNPVDFGRLHKEAEQLPDDDGWFDDDSDKPVLIAVGRMVPQKDFSTLLNAFALMRREVDARLIILGEGPLEPDLRNLAQRLGVDEHLRMPGFKANPNAYIARSDAFVLSSAWEGLPNVLLQAMALGVPIISTDCPSGPSELLVGGQYGHLVPVGDATALADAVVRALRGDTRKAPDEWMEQFQSSRVARRYAAAVGLE